MRPASLRTFHSSPLSNETARRQESRLKKSKHQAARTEGARLAKANRPHPALGYAPGNESLWRNSKLCRILLTEDKVQQLPIPKATIEMEPEKAKTKAADGHKYDFKMDQAEAELTGRMVPKLVDGRPAIIEFDTPKIFNYGVGEREKRLIFDDLTEMRKWEYTIQKDEAEARKEVMDKLRAAGTDPTKLPWSSQDEDSAVSDLKFSNDDDYTRHEDANKYWFGRLLDIRNASAKGLEFENKKRIVEAFSTQGKVNDPGLPEVQGSPLSLAVGTLLMSLLSLAALKTYRIHVIWDHLLTKKNDIHNRRRLLGMVHERAKILHYLRQTYRGRYEALLPELGLERGAVEGQLQLSRQLTPI